MREEARDVIVVGPGYSSAYGKKGLVSGYVLKV